MEWISPQPLLTLVDTKLCHVPEMSHPLSLFMYSVSHCPSWSVCVVSARSGGSQSGGGATGGGDGTGRKTDRRQPTGGHGCGPLDQGGSTDKPELGVFTMTLGDVCDSECTIWLIDLE